MDPKPMKDGFDDYFVNNISSLDSDMVVINASIGTNKSEIKLTISVGTIFAIVFIVVALVLNILTVILIVRLRRRVSYFVVSLSIASILGILDQIPGTLDYHGFVNLRGDLLCGAMGFIRNFPSVVTPVSVAGDTWYRIRKPVPERGKAAALRVLGLTWLVSCATLFPTCFMYSYEGTSENQRPICTRARLLNSYWVTVAYYWHRFVLYHVFISIYLCYAFYQTKLRVKASLFGSDIPVSMQRGIYRLRLMFLHHLIFCIVWVPVGLFFPIQYMLSDGKQMKFRPMSTQRVGSDVFLADLIPIICFIFLSLHPPFFYMTHRERKPRGFSTKNPDPTGFWGFCGF